MRLPILLLIAFLGTAGCDRDSSPTSGPRSAEAVFAEWRGITDQNKRRHLAEEMLRDGHLTGMTHDQVVGVLGEPNARQMSAAYGDPKYIVGPSGTHHQWLSIHVENGKVARVELRSD